MLGEANLLRLYSTQWRLGLFNVNVEFSLEIFNFDELRVFSRSLFLTVFGRTLKLICAVLTFRHRASSI